MAKIPEPKIGDKVPVDVRIVNVNNIPAKYFLHDEILQALQRIIRTEVVVRGEPVPPGAQAVFSAYTTAAAAKRFAIANDNLKHEVKRAAPALIFFWLVIAGGTVIAWLVWRWLNG
jgi:hypothetical protein